MSGGRADGVMDADYMYEPGDMGAYELVQAGVDAGGNPVYAPRCTKWPKYTGGFNVDGSPTLAAPPGMSRAVRSLGGVLAHLFRRPR